MTTLVEYLETFNRKERFFLIGEALGNPTFRLSSDFIARLNDAFSLDAPPDAFAAMDYHLDWTYACLYLVGKDETPIHRNPDRAITGNQEDTDFLVAWEREGMTHLLLLEAKVETRWTNRQLKSKADRLRRIFGDEGARHPQVTPHFGLTSPRRPQRIDTSRWPAWMSRGGEPIWFGLEAGVRRRQATRCDSSGRKSATGGHFRVRRRSV